MTPVVDSVNMSVLVSFSADLVVADEVGCFLRLWGLIDLIGSGILLWLFVGEVGIVVGGLLWWSSESGTEFNIG